MLDKLTSLTPESLAAPEVKPAADAIEALAGLANKYVTSVNEITNNPDLSDQGKVKLTDAAKAEFEDKAQELRSQIVALGGGQAAKVDKLVAAARVADKPANLGPDASFEATLAMERFKHMGPHELVSAYESAIEGKDYINRRAIEAVAGSVLEKGTGEHLRFEALHRDVHDPQTPEIIAARAGLVTLDKLWALCEYVTANTLRTGVVPFSKD